MFSYRINLLMSVSSILIESVSSASRDKAAEPANAASAWRHTALEYTLSLLFRFHSEGKTAAKFILFLKWLE